MCPRSSGRARAVGWCRSSADPTVAATGDPGEETRSFTFLGGQSIDLTEVVADHVYIRAYTIIGTTEIIVPDGASVDLDGHIVFGGSGNKALRNGPSTMRVVVRARGALGRLEVRNLKRRERKKRER